MTNYLEARITFVYQLLLFTLSVNIKKRILLQIVQVEDKGAVL